MTIKNSLENQYESVDASPVKSFFVLMLTRDIKLEDAILDLLDNCVDGILRTKTINNNETIPYKGFWATIEFNKDYFKISDNCGGIPWDLHDYAFRMGRADDCPVATPGTVGVYGIGMKRAIFKMGEECHILTQNSESSYEIILTPQWMHDEEDWNIPVKASKKSMASDGTIIIIKKLRTGIAALFKENRSAFMTDLKSKVATHYAFIIDKGFEIKINNEAVIPRPTKLVFTKTTKRSKSPVIKPFIFQSEIDDVKVFLAVGFTRPIPSQEEIEGEQEETRYSSLDAGWTIICNDRAVLYCDRTELTGWGEAGVPRYHTQFTAISGIVDFRSEDASKLPTTTTKRGIDASSTLYLQVKNKMREGMRLFTDYTNKWKGRAEESRKHIEQGQTLSLHELKSEAKQLPYTSTRKTIAKGEQYKPSLPMPKGIETQSRRISFIKNIDEIKCVAEHLYGDPTKDPSSVGEKCFDLILKEAKE